MLEVKISGGVISAFFILDGLAAKEQHILFKQVQTGVRTVNNYVMKSVILFIVLHRSLASLTSHCYL
jgi:hypothetical protein